MCLRLTVPDAVENQRSAPKPFRDQTTETEPATLPWRFGVTEPETPDNEKKRSWVGVIVRVVLFGVLIYLLWGFFAVIDWSAVVDGVRNLSGRAWLGLILFSFLRIVAEAWVLMAVLPGLGAGHAVLAFLAPSAAASVIPGPADLVARFAMYNSWGFSNEDTSISVFSSWIFTTGAKISLPIFAAIGIFIAGRTGADFPELETIAIIAAAVLIGAAFILVLVLRSEDLARSTGAWFGRVAKRISKPFRIGLPETVVEDIEEQFANFQTTAGVVIRERWLMATVAALLAQFLQYMILLISMRGVGVTSDMLNPAEIFAAFSLVQLLTAIPITPGGLGIAEAGYVTALAGQSNKALADTVTAGTLVYRLFSWILIIPLGGIAWLLWNRTLPKEESVDEPG